MSTSAQPVTSQNTSTYSPNTDNLQRAVLDPQMLLSRANTIPAPSPRIEITPSGDSLSSQTIEPSPGSKSLGAYRECVSPASSNSSTGWQADIYSPITSPCVTPPHGGSYGASLPALDLCPSMQNINTSSAHSSPGTSPRNSVTDETFLQPHLHSTASPLPHRRSRSTSPQGKRCLQQAGSCQEGTPVKQRSRSPSPIPVPHEHQYQHYLYQNQAQTEFQPQAQTSVPGLEEVLSSLSSSLPRAVPHAVGRGAQPQAQRQDRAYGETYEWTLEQETACRVGHEVKSETIYMLPARWAPTQQGHHAGRSTFRWFVFLPPTVFFWSGRGNCKHKNTQVFKSANGHICIILKWNNFNFFQWLFCDSTSLLGVDIAQSVRPVWAADPTTAQVPPQSSLWDWGQPRSRQDPQWRASRNSGVWI